MRRPSLRPILRRFRFSSVRIVPLLAFLFLTAVLSHADENPPTKPTKLPPSIQQAVAESTRLKQQSESARKQAKEAADQLADLKQQITKNSSELESLKKSLTEIQAQLKADQAAASTALTAKQKADKAAAAAAKAATEAADKAKKTELAAQELQKKSVAATASMTAATKAIPALEKTIPAANQAALKFHQEWLTQEQKIQQLLIDAKLWVSFTNEIAPIFAQRCLVCHNSRKPGGKLNLETYSALIAGGESGAVIDLKQPDESLLITLIEDGSMPQDADPLSPEQIAMVKRWVTNGARLDFGVKAEAPLIQIMPRVIQPKAPKTYRVPVSVTALAFSPDGKTLASSGYHEVLLWSVENHALKQRITNVAERVYEIQFSTDGKRIAVATGTPGRLGEAKIFNVSDGALVADLLISSEVVLGVSFSPDGTLLATCGADHKVRVFELATKQLKLEVEGNTDWAMDVAWSPDGKRLVTCGLDKTAKVFDLATGKTTCSFNAHTDGVTAVAFLGNGTQAVSAGRDRVLRVWEVSDAKEIRKIGGIGNEVSHLRVLPENLVVSAGLDKVPHVHNTKDGKLVRNFAAQPEPLFALAVHPASGIVATGSLNGDIQLWNLADGKALEKWSAVPSVSATPATAVAEPENTTPPAAAKRK